MQAQVGMFSAPVTRLLDGGRMYLTTSAWVSSRGRRGRDNATYLQREVGLPPASAHCPCQCLMQPPRNSAAHLLDGSTNRRIIYRVVRAALALSATALSKRLQTCGRASRVHVVGKR